MFTPLFASSQGLLPLVSPDGGPRPRPLVSCPLVDPACSSRHPEPHHRRRRSPFLVLSLGQMDRAARSVLRLPGRAQLQSRLRWHLARHDLRQRPGPYSVQRHGVFQRCAPRVEQCPVSRLMHSPCRMSGRLCGLRVLHHLACPVRPRRQHRHAVHDRRRDRRLRQHTPHGRGDLQLQLPGLQRAIRRRAAHTDRRQRPGGRADVAGPAGLHQVHVSEARRSSCPCFVNGTCLSLEPQNRGRAFALIDSDCVRQCYRPLLKCPRYPDFRQSAGNDEPLFSLGESSRERQELLQFRDGHDSGHDGHGRDDVIIIVAIVQYVLLGVHRLMCIFWGSFSI